MLYHKFLRIPGLGTISSFQENDIRSIYVAFYNDSIKNIFDEFNPTIEECKGHCILTFSIDDYNMLLLKYGI